MSMAMMVRAMGMRVGNPTRKLILLKLADNANDLGECWPSYSHIAEQCEVSRRAVIEHIAVLSKVGLVERRRRSDNKGNRSNLYILHLPPLGGEPPHPSSSPDTDDDPGQTASTGSRSNRGAPTKAARSRSDTVEPVAQVEVSREDRETESEQAAGTDEIAEYVELAARHGKSRDPRGLRRYLRRHGLNADHQAELVEWRRMTAEARARGSGGATSASDYEQARSRPQEERWLAARDVLRQRMPTEEWEMWIAPVACPTVDDQDVIRLVGPDMYFTSWLLNKYFAVIQATMAEIGATGDILFVPGARR